MLHAPDSIDASELPLGGLDCAKFLRNYWQKKPLLIRQAIPGFAAPLTFREIFRLAANEDVESRLVTESRGTWKIAHGPFDSLPKKRSAWTLLVQGANLHDRRVDALMRRFRFIPYSRLDDLMISYAADGGGVGPHFDSYDVFLLQGNGQRRWRISAQTDLSLCDDVPLKILKHFKPEEEWVLDPGDMLYLPPHIAHEGVAVGECTTYSIGFRAPAYADMAREFLQDFGDTLLLPGRHGDPGRSPTDTPAKIEATLIKDISRQIESLRPSRRQISAFVGRALSEPKYSVNFKRPAALSRTSFERSARRRGLRLALKSQMLYRGNDFFCNGWQFSASGSLKRCMRHVANERRLPAADAMLEEHLEGDGGTLFYQWFLDGWLEFDA